MSAQDSYDAHLVSIRNQLAELQMKFGQPGKKDANWGDQGEVAQVDHMLKSITDRVFKRGEFAAE